MFIMKNVIVIQLEHKFIMMAQRTKTQLYCKNHQKQLGVFFLSEQPWVKFCSECALNMALCGKKIDKDLTAQEYDNKTQIMSIIQRMNRTLNRIEPSKRIIDEVTTKIDKASKSDIAQYVKNFDEYVRNLCEIRDQVVTLFEQQFYHSIQSYYQKQTKILLYEIQLKQNLAYIEANYRTIIEDKQQVCMTKRFQQWSNLVIQIDRILPSEKQASDTEQLIFEKTELLYNRLSSIQPFKINTTDFYKSRKQSKITEGPTSYESINLSQMKQNTRKTQLKLRSRSKQSGKRNDRESLKTRKSIRDISNFQVMESFHI